MRTARFSRLVIAVMLLFPVLNAKADEWRDVAPGDRVTLPGDLYFQKDYRIQWWYLTGHLFDQSGREFGYELTFFAAGVQHRVYRSRFGVDFIYLSHFAVSDVANNRFYHFPDADSGAYGFAGADSDNLHVWVDRARLTGPAEAMRISARTADVELQLSLEPRKPAVLHGNGGYSRKSQASPLDASLYFSFTDLATAGTLQLEGRPMRVSGTSWFDREITSRGLAGNEAGWDWFALQLDDGREIMLYEIRNRDGTLDPFSSGTIVQKDGEYRHLTRSDFTVKILDHYTSRRTGAKYPSRWQVAVPSERLSLRVIPLMQDQEFTSTGGLRKAYWEGTCRVEGSAAGRAYVEMTGYAE